MSILGRLNDLVTGNPAGTADAQSAADDAANQQLATLNQKEAQNIAQTQGQDAANAYTSEVAQDYSTDAEDPNSVDAAASEAYAGLSTLPDSLSDPVGTFENGLNWEASTAGSIAGGAVAAASSAAKTAVGSFFSKIPWWIYPLAAIGIFLYLGGGAFLIRKGRKALA